MCLRGLQKIAITIKQTKIYTENNSDEDMTVRRKKNE